MEPYVIETATENVNLVISDSCGGLVVSVEEVDEAVDAYLNEGQALRAILAMATRYNKTFTNRRCDVQFGILEEEVA
jgi:hypothetical protein